MTFFLNIEAHTIVIHRRKLFIPRFMQTTVVVSEIIRLAALRKKRTFLKMLKHYRREPRCVLLTHVLRLCLLTDNNVFINNDYHTEPDYSPRIALM